MPPSTDQSPYAAVAVAAADRIEEFTRQFRWSDADGVRGLAADIEDESKGLGMPPSAAARVWRFVNLVARVVAADDGRTIASALQWCRVYDPDRQGPSPTLARSLASWGMPGLEPVLDDDQYGVPRLKGMFFDVCGIVRASALRASVFAGTRYPGDVAALAASAASASAGLRGLRALVLSLAAYPHGCADRVRSADAARRSVLSAMSSRAWPAIAESADAAAGVLVAAGTMKSRAKSAAGRGFEQLAEELSEQFLTGGGCDGPGPQYMVHRLGDVLLTMAEAGSSIAESVLPGGGLRGCLRDSLGSAASLAEAAQVLSVCASVLHAAARLPSESLDDFGMSPSDRFLWG